MTKLFALVLILLGLVACGAALCFIYAAGTSADPNRWRRRALVALLLALLVPALLHLSESPTPASPPVATH